MFLPVRRLVVILLVRLFFFFGFLADLGFGLAANLRVGFAAFRAAFAALRPAFVGVFVLALRPAVAAVLPELNSLWRFFGSRSHTSR